MGKVSYDDLRPGRSMEAVTPETTDFENKCYVQDHQSAICVSKILPTAQKEERIRYVVFPHSTHSLDIEFVYPKTSI